MRRWEKPFYHHHSFFICNHLSLSACSCNSLVYTKFMCDSTNLQHRCSHSNDYCISSACRYKHFSIWKWYIPVLQSLSLCLNVGTICLILRRLLRAALIGTAKGIAFTNGGAGGCTRRSTMVLLVQSTNPLSGKGGCSWGWLRTTVHQLVTLAGGLFMYFCDPKYRFMLQSHYAALLLK